MRCPNCATELPDSAKFCVECGRDLRPRPGFASPAAYTPRHLAERILTTRAALEGEHKQVTVLFCDIANSTPLAERVGPERMHALLNGFFELA
ncbi:MAG TPA: zinc-ribbon domain-containing protein, partial [Candidatus Acidoferrum sp.]|nr:zinc-ribbon domain-containing protein [Candidatus Acidoferrum sp.]